MQKFEVVPVDRNDYGTFFSGDSYIVLSVSDVIREVECRHNDRQKANKTGMCIFGSEKTLHRYNKCH